MRHIQNAHRPTLFAIALLGCAALALGLLATAGRASNDPASQGAAPPSATTAVPAAAPAGVTAQTSSSRSDRAYSAFSGAPTPTDLAIGQSLQGRPLTRGAGLDLASARLVLREAVRTASIIQSSDGPCLAEQIADGSASLSCPDPAHGINDAISISVLGSIGTVPDSVQSVTVTGPDGSRSAIPVVRNVWHAPAAAAKVDYQLNGALVEHYLMPRSSLPADAQVSPTGEVTIGDPAAAVEGNG